MMYTGIGVLQDYSNLISVNPNIPVTEWTGYYNYIFID